MDLLPPAGHLIGPPCERTLTLFTLSWLVGYHTQVTVRLSNEANEFVFEPSVIELTAER